MATVNLCSLVSLGKMVGKGYALGDVRIQRNEAVQPPHIRQNLPISASGVILKHRHLLRLEK